MVYDFALTSPPYDWYIYRQTIARFVSVKKNIKILEKKLVFAYLSFILLLVVMASATSFEYQKHLFSNDC